MQTLLAGSADLISVISSTVSSIAISIAQDWSTRPYLLTSCGGVLGSTSPRWPRTTLRISPSGFAPPWLFRDLENGVSDWRSAPRRRPPLCRVLTFQMIKSSCEDFQSRSPVAAPQGHRQRESRRPKTSPERNIKDEIKAHLRV